MTYRFAKTYPDEMLFLPAQILKKLDDAGETEIRVLLMLAGALSRGAKEEEELAAELEKEFSHDAVLEALSYWRGAGVLLREEKSAGRKKGVKTVQTETEREEKPEKKVQKPAIDADEAPFYSAKDLSEAAQNNPEFKTLVEFAQTRLEKVLNTSELARIWEFLDYLKMPASVVMLVIEDCAARGKTSLRYISKVLLRFQDEGLDTYEKAEAYFVARKDSAVFERKIREMFGLGDRKLTASEEKTVDAWRTFGFSDEMLDEAYEKTVRTAKKPTISYMNTILESWHQSGYTTPEEVKNAAPKKADGKADRSYVTKDFFERAVIRGRKDL